ncbi:MAG TPA: hypothetical protein VN976_03015 [Verrucomicrobiae bacterium]|nr:hypothetical protein [Verrucomicrobiae bacterium]
MKHAADFVDPFGFRGREALFAKIRNPIKWGDDVSAKINSTHNVLDLVHIFQQSANRVRNGILSA